MPGPLPVDLAATAAGATATVKGTIGDPRRVGDVALQVALGMPDLAALSPLAGTPLPAVKDLTVDFRLAERGFFFSGGAFLKGLRSPPRPRCRGRPDLCGRHAAGAARHAGLAPHRPRRAGAAGRPASTPAGGGPAMPAAPPAPPARDGRVIPDLPLPLELLRVTDSELRWTSRGAATRAASRCATPPRMPRSATGRVGSTPSPPPCRAGGCRCAPRPMSPPPRPACSSRRSRTGSTCRPCWRRCMRRAAPPGGSNSTSTCAARAATCAPSPPPRPGISAWR